MPTPRQVKRAARRAEREHAAAYSVEDAENVAEEATEPEALAPEQAAAPEPEAAPEEVAAPAPEPDPEPEQSAPEPEADPDDDWEQKYKVLQGKYNAEVPRYARELRDLRDQLDSRTQILAGLERMQHEPAPQYTNGADGPSITAAERDDYGEDFLDVVARQAQIAIAPQLQQLQQTLAKMDQGVGYMSQRVQQSDQERVYAHLDATVPQWRTLNNDDSFLIWLDQMDRFAGRTRRDLITEAFGNYDAPRVAAFFTSYQEENAAVSPAPSDPPPPARSEKVSMSQLVAPGTPREAGSADAQDGKRTWTQAQIASFYTDVQRGKFRDADADKVAIEKDIVAAASEGRIIG